MLSNNLRSNTTMDAINSQLSAIGEPQRLSEQISGLWLPGAAVQAGEWYFTNDGKLAAIWTIPSNGLMLPFLSFFSQNSSIEKTIPLSSTAEIFILRDGEGIGGVWMQRMTTAAKIMQEKPLKKMRRGQ